MLSRGSTVRATPTRTYNLWISCQVQCWVMCPHIAAPYHARGEIAERGGKKPRPKLWGLEEQASARLKSKGSHETTLLGPSAPWCDGDHGFSKSIPENLTI